MSNQERYLTKNCIKNDPEVKKELDISKIKLEIKYGRD